MVEPAQTETPVIVVASATSSPSAKAETPATSEVATREPTEVMESPSTALATAEMETKNPPAENSDQLYGEKKHSEDCGVYRSVTSITDTLHIIIENKNLNCEDQKILRELPAP
ncbi:MAG: hypothetical protein ACD_67C00026G0001 [uncultured bacterium]|nr:MAG: hypothetical protein ACD_67C00026G0001 [uncultured bacterium]